MSCGGERLYGKYRGTVLENVDPQMSGRLLVHVPDVTGPNPSTWALPCASLAGLRNGMLSIPVKGSQVWVEYEQGDTDHPIWVGCFWGPGELPPLAMTTPAAIPAITLQTLGRNGLTVSDLPGPGGGIVLRSASGASVIVNDTGIYIKNGRGAEITLIGRTVDVNHGALTID